MTESDRRARLLATLHDASRQLIETESKAEIGRVAVDIAAEMDALQARIDLIHPDTGALETVATAGDVTWDEDSFRHAVASGRTQYLAATGEFVTADVAEHEDREPVSSDVVETVTGLRLPLSGHGVLGIDADGTLDPFMIELAHVLSIVVEAALDGAQRERQLATQAERLEEFAALSSHELRNRLQIALGTAERAHAQNDVAAVEEVIEALDRMNRLVSQLLALAQTGTVNRATESVALSGIAETAWHTVGGEATLSVEDDAIITADRDGLLEVFEMLFRAMVDGADSNRVRVGTLSRGFYVEDDAATIRPSDFFEPTSTDEEGDSVYLVSVIAKAHEWDVDIEASDDGTRFTFRNVDIAHVE